MNNSKNNLLNNNIKKLIYNKYHSIINNNKNINSIDILISEKEVYALEVIESISNKEIFYNRHIKGYLLIVNNKETNSSNEYDCYILSKIGHVILKNKAYYPIKHNIKLKKINNLFINS